MASDPPNDKLPTAVIADRIGEYLWPDSDLFKFVFKAPNGEKFAISGDIKQAVGLLRMCSSVIAQYHQAKPEKGAFMHGSMLVNDAASQGASVGSSPMMRGAITISFEGSIMYVISVETAAELVELIKHKISETETPAERAARLQKKAPLIATPKHKIILP